jgi:hypothetical protein
MSDMKTIWETLSKADVSPHVEKKGRMNYLSWAWAWGYLMEHYPDATYEIHPPTLYGIDDSVEVSVTVTINGMSRFMWLPVMDNRNNAIQKPSSRDISDARMRCLVKCLAMFGLGHFLYAGEDIPSEDKQAPQGTMAGRDDYSKSGDDLPWYNNFDSDCAMMLEKINSGERTPQQILDNLTAKFRVSNKVKEAILNLGK